MVSPRHHPMVFPRGAPLASGLQSQRSWTAPSVWPAPRSRAAAISGWRYPSRCSRSTTSGCTRARDNGEARMLEPAMIWILGAGLTATSSTAVLALPALLAVRRVLAMRGTAPLPRGGLERDLVMGAGVIGALGAMAWADGCALALGSYGAAEMAILLATCVA